ncbi:N(4)-acetylcytidine aminohydrolase [Escherichia coli]|nr:N(4)-acetylcytidine aminohydrolase [Escherichia coli]
MQPNDITFFQRFQDDILAGRKTITIRDESESHFKTGDVLRVGRFEDDGYFCTIEVTATSTVTLDTLTEKHAQQENMTLWQLNGYRSSATSILARASFMSLNSKRFKIIRNSC